MKHIVEGIVALLAGAPWWARTVVVLAALTLGSLFSPALVAWAGR